MRIRILAICAICALGLGSAQYLGCDGGEIAEQENGKGDGGGYVEGDGGPPPKCEGGTDKDGDGYGEGCPAGDDCDDDNPSVNPGANEVCDGVDNNCDGQVDDGVGTCNAMGQGQPFPTDKTQDDNLQDATGVVLDQNGDLILGSSQANFHYMWIANTDDINEDGVKRGTISKVDTASMKEVGRYFTITCRSDPTNTGCKDINGKDIKAVHRNLPSRTAVDFNMDVWVANRCRDGGQPSATKIANDPIDCIDRNNNKKIDTSADHNGDGQITWDCDDDGQADTLATTCTGAHAGTPPEFLGDDDECILMTVNYGDMDDIGRSVCLDAGKSTIGASNAWVGTFARPYHGNGNNRYYKINGTTGAIEQVVEIHEEHHAYGCMADAHNIVWSTDIGTSDDGEKWNGSLTYFQTISPYQVGTLLRGPDVNNHWKDKDGEYHHYGISINADQHVWLGGWTSSWVLRYKPVRTSFDTLKDGTWTRIDIPNNWYTRGIAADDRDKVWVAIHQGYILRLDQTVADGEHDQTGMQLNQGYWKTTSATNIGVGVDFDGNVWAVGFDNDTASRLDVDQNGDVKQPPTAESNNVTIGAAPYTYSDFTGFGLMNFVRPQGRWTYQHTPCPEGTQATWTQVSWKATTPPGTGVTLRVRTGDSVTTFGDWSQPFETSPAVFGPGSAAPISPNPAATLQVEFTLATKDKAHTPTLHEYVISYTCLSSPD